MDTRQHYPSDLSRAEWAQVSCFIRASKKDGRPAKYDRREIVNALLYVARTGCQWRALPHGLPPWTIVYWYFRSWKADGPPERLMAELRERLAAGRGPGSQPSAAILDSQSVKTTEKGAARLRRGQEGQRSQAAHRGLARPGTVRGPVHPADVQDRDGAKLMIERLPLIWADGDYAGRLVA